MTTYKPQRRLLVLIIFVTFLNIISRCHAVLTHEMETNLVSAKEMVEKGQFSEAFHYINLASSEANPPNNDLPLNEQAEVAVNQLSKLIEENPRPMILRELRTECFLFLHRNKEAKKELQLIVKAKPQNTNALFKLAKISYNLGELNDSVSYAKACSKSDPDHKECSSHHKTVKRIENLYSEIQTAYEKENYGVCVVAAKRVIKAVEEMGAATEITYQVNGKLCDCLFYLKEYEESLKRCNLALQHRWDPQVLCDRAYVYIALDRLDEATADFKQALLIDESLWRAKMGLQDVRILKEEQGDSQLLIALALILFIVYLVYSDLYYGIVNLLVSWPLYKVYQSIMYIKRRLTSFPPTGSNVYIVKRTS